MRFNIIDEEKWSRKPYFDQYLHTVRCTYSINVNIDITELLAKLRESKLKLYPTFIYMVSRVVNANREFKTCFNDQDVLGYWDKINPSYTVFHRDDKTFSSIWTEYCNDFSVFYQKIQDDMRQYGNVKGILAKPNCPPNIFNISSIPWVSFNGFNLNIFTDGRYLLPIITNGKYFRDDHKILLPVALQVHHAVCDGYHASLFMNEIQNLALSTDAWLNI